MVKRKDLGETTVVRQLRQESPDTARLHQLREAEDQRGRVRVSSLLARTMDFPRAELSAPQGRGPGTGERLVTIILVGAALLIDRIGRGVKR